MPQRRLPNGRFAKVVNVPEAKRKQTPKIGSGTVRTQIIGLKSAADQIEDLNRSVSRTLLADPDDRARRIQQRMRAAATRAYHSGSATGRFSRGIVARAQKVGTADGEGIETAVVVTMIDYRESKFLTNLGGFGYFKTFPVGPYRIFAKGAEGLDDLSNPSTGRVSKKSRAKALTIAKNTAQGRLKVPRNTAFFVTDKPQGRGGRENRRIADQFGTPDFSKKSKLFPNLSADPKGDYFFYPLWVDHPGFARDVVSEVALKEGASFKSEVIDAVALKLGEVGPHGFPVSQTLPETDVVVSNIIPLPGTAVYLTGRTDQRSQSQFVAVPKFLLNIK